MLSKQVYFIHAPSAGLVKIGRSIHIERRLHAIRLISPVELELLGTVPGHSGIESIYHNRWSHLRHHGEWFTATPELMTQLQFDVLCAAWNKADADTRQMFEDWRDTPVFDNTRAAA